MAVNRRGSGQHHGDLRTALEKAALTLVAERGPQGFTLAETCRLAGVSVAAPYKHFADRDALLASLAASGYREQHRRYSAAVLASDDPADQIAAFAAAYVRFAAEEQALFDVTFNAGLDKALYAELRAAGQELFNTLMPIARRITPNEADAFDLLVRVASAAHGLALFLRQGIFGVEHPTLPVTEARAARTARAIIDDQQRKPTGHGASLRKTQHPDR